MAVEHVFWSTMIVRRWEPVGGTPTGSDRDGSRSPKPNLWARLSTADFKMLNLDELEPTDVGCYELRKWQKNGSVPLLQK